MDNVALSSRSLEQKWYAYSQDNTGVVADETKVIKLPNSDAKIDRLYQDALVHQIVFDTFADPSLKSIDISVPNFSCWMNSSSKSWATYGPSLPPSFQTTKYGIVSQRIFPLPQPTREAIIDTFCPVRLTRTAKLDDKNKHCLIRVYLGDRQHDQKRQATSRFSIRNFPLLVNDMERLNLDTASFAKNMASALAVLHWKAGVDGNDVEFVIGSKPFYKPKLFTQAVEALEKDDEKHADCDIDFRHRVNHLWLLDFNECTRFSETETDNWLTLLVNAFYHNDPYYPKSASSDERDVELWSIFRQSYLEVGFDLTGSPGPRMFIDAVEVEGKRRHQKIAQQGSESLLGTLLRH